MTIEPATGQPIPSEMGGEMDLGKPVMEPQIDASSVEAPEIKIPKGGEI